ncbi:hypothetical protein Nepgr_003668 [Nepenthes gracilis]|uniref:Uncharacterized protein n=1 Tax=Nepenthes gracilis TaxID=150966 RepID=A0AAD3XDZ1_NEPGR|nr:hypothetical protein Nepgr_003668 [Nepenthes gracilis]
MQLLPCVLCAEAALKDAKQSKDGIDVEITTPHCEVENTKQEAKAVAAQLHGGVGLHDFGAWLPSMVCLIGTGQLHCRMKVQGLGTSLRSLKNKKAEGSSQLLSEISKSHANGVNSASPSADSQNGTSDNDAELALRKVLSDGAFTRLKESKTGLHRKVT